MKEFHERKRDVNDGMARSITLALLILILILRLSGTVFAQGTFAETRAVPVEERPKIDRLVNEEIWKSAPPATDFIQQDPSFGAPATERTEVRFLFTQDTLFIGVICFDSEPDRILVSQSRRDGDLKDDDSIQILIDTFHDKQNGFVFGTNPTGVEYDGQVSKEGRSGGFTSAATSNPGAGAAQTGAIGGFNLNWDATWEVRAQITQRGWEAAFAIPFSTLRYSSSNEAWGLNIQRIVRRKNEISFWSQIPRSLNIYKVSMAGSLKGIEPGHARKMQLIPYVLGGAQKNYLTHVRKGIAEVGLDSKYGLTPSLTLDLTYNTDFAQVEVDDQQINLTRFDLFFPEKRPFFLENAGSFQFGTPQDAEIFFSRRIGIGPSGAMVPIIGGARLTGKVGRYSLGLLDMQTEKSEGVAPANNFFVGRLNREFLTRSTMGFIFVNRRATSYVDHDRDNQTVGVDANFGFGRDLTLYSYLAKTRTPGLNGKDMAGRVLLDYNSDKWIVRGGYEEMGDNFNPEVGFLRRRAYRKPDFTMHYTPRPGKGLVRKHDPHFSVTRFYGNDGLLESELLHFDYSGDFQNGGSVGAAYNRKYEFLRVPYNIVPSVSIPTGGYNWDEFQLRFKTNPSAHIFTDVRYTRSRGLYDGRLDDLSIAGGLRTSEKFIVNLNYRLNAAKLPWGDFNLNLVRLKVNYSFSPSIFLQALFQYNSVLELISSNIRFGLLGKSGTGLYLVYNDQHETLHGDFPVLGRSLSIKYSHLLEW